MRRLSCLIFAAALLGVVHLPAFGQEKKKEDTKALAQVLPCCPPGHTFAHLNGKPLVFVVNGAGAATNLSDNLQDVNESRNFGLHIQMVPWTRYDSACKDLTDHEAQLKAAARIACTVTAIRRDCPNMPIFLIGHSAGARVVLAAAEMMPERSVDRVIVLAPAVSCGYDLTGALRASRGGVDNFYSPDDGILQAATYHSTLADGLKGPAAGQVGFHAASTDRAAVLAYRNLRQHRWTEEYCGSGGHIAWVGRMNLKRAVVPLFFAGSPIVEPAVAEVRRMPPAK